MSTGQKFRFGFLTTIDNPLLPFMLSAALSNKCEDIVVICDERLSSEKDMKRWNERTRGAFEKMNGEKASVYSLGSSSTPFYFVKNHNNEQTLNLIETLKVDCLLNAGTPRRLNEGIINICEYGIVNVHPGLLPKYRGCTAVEWALYNDDRVGNTAHFMDEDYDTGPIIDSEWYEFPKDSDYQSIRVKVYKERSALTGRVLAKIKNQKIKPKDTLPQDESKAQFWKPIPDDKLDVVIRKLNNSEYRYQVL